MISPYKTLGPNHQLDRTELLNPRGANRKIINAMRSILGYESQPSTSKCSRAVSRDAYRRTKRHSEQSVEFNGEGGIVVGRRGDDGGRAII